VYKQFNRAGFVLRRKSFTLRALTANTLRYSIEHDGISREYRFVDVPKKWSQAANINFKIGI
jgi:hypothetical protein